MTGIGDFLKWVANSVASAASLMITSHETSFDLEDARHLCKAFNLEGQLPASADGVGAQQPRHSLDRRSVRLHVIMEVEQGPSVTARAPPPQACGGAQAAARRAPRRGRSLALCFRTSRAGRALRVDRGRPVVAAA